MCPIPSLRAKTWARLPSGVRLFGWVRRRTWAAGLRALLAAPLKLGVIICMWGVLLGALYALAYRGIRFIYDAAGLGPFLLSRMWFLLLFVVMILLAVSQLASAYSTLVRAPETRWWMILPVSARTLCRAKWLESSGYSAWAVGVLAVPLLLAYVVVLQRSWWLVVWAGVVVLVPLIVLTTAVSTTLLLVWLRWLGRMMVRRELMLLGFLVACAALFWILGERQQETQQEVWFLALQALLPRMQVAMSKWLPSCWAATALDAGLNSRWVEGAVYAALLWSTAFLAWRLLDHVAAAWLFAVLRQHAHPSEGTGAAPCPVTPRTWARVTPWWMRRPLMAFLAKDVLLVLRDPIQWSQAVVFFGLLGAYFANIHRLAQLSVEPSWRVGVASLNLASTLLVFGSLAVRFVFPQMSIEGRSLWFLRAVPGGMRRLLLSKLCLYSVIAIVVVEGLLTLSAIRLGVAPIIRWWLAGVGVVAALTLVALTVGCGAWWIDLTAQDAARVVSSSNGALVLVWMLAYVGCVIAALIAVWTTGAVGPWRGMSFASGGLVLSSVIAGGVPVRQGLHRLEHLEYTV